MVWFVQNCDILLNMIGENQKTFTFERLEAVRFGISAEKNIQMIER